MVAVNFTRKKVGSLTLGEKLRKIRNDHRIGLAEASKATKIQVKYLEALEDGSYEKLPPEVYVRGFLRGYAAFLGVPEDAILRMYDRERSIQRNLGRGESFRFQPQAPVRFRFDVSPRTLVTVSIIAVSIGFFSYLYLEFRSFVSEPRLVITEPRDGSVVDAAEILVSGETDHRATVRINGEETIVSEEGRFSERVTLTPGLNTVSVASVNRFGKERVKTVSVNADTPDIPAMPIAPEDIAAVGEKMRLSVRVVREVTVTVRSDGETVFSGRFGPEEPKLFEADEEIYLASGDGSAVLVRVGDGPEEPLSSGTGSVERTFRPVREDTGGEPPEAESPGS
jgi:cytoskeletal protein RodZ